MFTYSLLLCSDAQALFKWVITTFLPEHARPLWEMWACYEYQYGDLEAAQKLEKRIAKVYPSGMYAHSLDQDMKLTVLSRFAHQTICSATHIPWNWYHCSVRSWFFNNSSSAYHFSQHIFY